MTTHEKTKRLTLMAMFAALAYIVVAVGRIPISSVSFLKYDPKDIILAICGFMMGPIPALSVATVVSLIEMLTLSETGLIGFLMNLLASASFACFAAAIYKKKHTLFGAALGLTVGALAMTAAMLMWNYFITPFYMGMPRSAIAEMLVPVFLPFNLVKSGLNAAITMLIYKPVSRALKRAGLAGEDMASSATTHKSALGAGIIALVLLASCIFAILVMRGIL